MKLILDTEKRTISEIPQESDKSISKYILEADISNILAMYWAYKQRCSQKPRLHRSGAP